jgi:hypothetical protein
LGQPPDESGVGAAEYGDLVPQHKELDVLGGGRAAYQQDESTHLPEDQIQQAQRHIGDHARAWNVVHHRQSATADPVLEPHRVLPTLECAPHNLIILRIT